MNDLNDADDSDDWEDSSFDEQSEDESSQQPTTTTVKEPPKIVEEHLKKFDESQGSQQFVESLPETIEEPSTSTMSASQQSFKRKQQFFESMLFKDKKPFETLRHIPEEKPCENETCANKELNEDEIETPQEENGIQTEGSEFSDELQQAFSEENDEKSSESENTESEINEPDNENLYEIETPAYSSSLPNKKGVNRGESLRSIAETRRQTFRDYSINQKRSIQR